MMSQTVRKEIDCYLNRLRETSPLFQNARNGKLRPENVTSYVFNIGHLVNHTLPHLALAVREAEKLGLSELALYFQSKIVEETGHEMWAEEDLQRIRGRYGSTPVQGVSPYIQEIIDEIESSILCNPSLYVLYMLFAEYQTVMAGPELLGMIETRCQIPMDMLSVVGNHIELDREHAEEGLKKIDLFLKTPQMSEEVSQQLQKFIMLFEKFFDQIGRIEH